MNKCKKYLNFVNSDSFDENDKEAYSNILKHTESCSQCLKDKNIRESMLLNLSNLNEPDYPVELHEKCVESLFNTQSTNTQSLFTKLIISSLKPIEISLSLACIIMFFYIIQLNFTPKDNIEITNNSNKIQKYKLAAVSDNINEDGIQKVSSEEVKEFLTKLDEFKKLHPKKEVENFNYQIRLVTDK